jgi:hypothetical protein
MKTDAPPPISLTDCIAAFSTSPLARWGDFLPWELTRQSENIVRQLLATLDLREFKVAGEVAIHASATVENGAVIKGPCILGAHCFVAAGAYLRGGNWVADHCTFGPGSELKSSFVFYGTQLAHFNFVGDAILGSDVNLEAGSITAMSAKTRRYRCTWAASAMALAAISSVPWSVTTAASVPMPCLRQEPSCPQLAWSLAPHYGTPRHEPSLKRPLAQVQAVAARFQAAAAATASSRCSASWAKADQA